MESDWIKSRNQRRRSPLGVLFSKRFFLTIARSPGNLTLSTNSGCENYSTIAEFGDWDSARDLINNQFGAGTQRY